MTTTLTSQRVEEIFIDCLFTDDEDHSDHVEAKGIINIAWFHPERLESHRDEIVSLLNELPEPFHEGGGGGWSFLQACEDKHGHQWTGLHLRMEQLFLLGMAIGRVRSILPRDLWRSLPGGMPYYAVTAE